MSSGVFHLTLSFVQSVICDLLTGSSFPSGMIMITLSPTLTWGLAMSLPPLELITALDLPFSQVTFPFGILKPNIRGSASDSACPIAGEAMNHVSRSKRFGVFGNGAFCDGRTHCIKNSSQHAETLRSTVSKNRARSHYFNTIMIFFETISIQQGLLGLEDNFRGRNL